MLVFEWVARPSLSPIGPFLVQASTDFCMTEYIFDCCFKRLHLKWQSLLTTLSTCIRENIKERMTAVYAHVRSSLCCPKKVMYCLKLTVVLNFIPIRMQKVLLKCVSCDAIDVKAYLSHFHEKCHRSNHIIYKRKRLSDGAVFTLKGF